MSRVAKYRRQVSEDPDIDSLLSTLSPEEMEELEKELDNGESDSRLAVGLRQKNQSDKVDAVPKQAENQIKIRNEEARVLEDVKKIYSKKDVRHIEEKGKEACPKNMDKKQKSDQVKDQKKEECGMKSSRMEKEDRQNKINDKPKETFPAYTENGRLKKTGGKILSDENQTAIENKKPTSKKGEENKFHKISDKAEKPAENKDLVGKLSKTIGKGDSKTVYDKDVEEKSLSLKVNQKDAGMKISSTEPTKNSADKDKTSSFDTVKTKTREIPEAGPEQLSAKYLTDPNTDDEATSIFVESLENVKKNDPELTELNVNNSDCITIETLMSFTEALEFNTVVKVFALANTRADDHIALAIAAMLKSNKTLTSINLDSNHITSKGILAIFRALQHNKTLTELRFHNQRHICGGKTEMEIAKMLKENITLLKLGYHFELAGPRMTVTNLLSRNMDKQRQKRLQEQKQKQVLERVENKNLLDVPKIAGLPKSSPKSSPQASPKSSPWSSPKSTPKKGGIPNAPPPPPPPLAPLVPPLINENIRNSLSPASQRKMIEKVNPSEKNSRDQLLDAIRCSNIKKLNKVEVPKLLQ